MTRKPSVRVVQNRKALTALRSGLVDSLEAFGQQLIAGITPPDDPTTETRIVGDWGVWSDGKKVAGTAKKPRRADIKKGAVLLAGFPFPARFNEMGTIHQPARPFLTPRHLEMLSAFPNLLRTAVITNFGRGIR